jgi:hypothetical protein
MNTRILYTILIILFLASCENKTESTTDNATATITNNNGATIFDSPEENARNIIKVGQNEQIEILANTNISGKIEGAEGTWFKVKYKNIEGYMLNSFLGVSGQSSNNPTSTDNPREDVNNPNNNYSGSQSNRSPEPKPIAIDKASVQDVIEGYFDATSRHQDITFYFAPLVEKFYLTTNVSNQKVLEYSQDWWLKTPYEQFDVLWNTAQYNNLGNGNIALVVQVDYAKKVKEYNDWTKNTIRFNIKINEEYKIYSLH